MKGLEDGRVLTLKAKEDERGEHQRASALSHKGSPGDSCDAPRLRVTGDTDPRLAVWYKNGMRFTCIYCLRSEPDVAPSEAHIVPFVMGGSTSTRDTVCLACNSHVNRRVEMRALDSFLVFQSIFGIRGRRNTIRRVHGVLETEDLKANVSLNEHGEITEATVIPTKDKDGKTSYYIFGPLDSVEEKRGALSERYPHLKWEEVPKPTRAMVWIDFDVRLGAPEFRRLAAKIAFEYFASLRSASFVAHSEFDGVRRFILDGDKPQCLVGAVSDRKQYDLFKGIGVPHHTVWLTSHPLDHVLGAIVGLYGLFYYWVILSTAYTALGPMDEILIEYPQKREAERPLLRAQMGTLRLPWVQMVSAYTRDAATAEKAAQQYARERFNAAADRFYGPNT